jgi:hypothetical protein
MRVFVAILLGGLTSAMYALSTSLQALEARRTSAQEALRASLLETLVRRRLWVLGTVCGLVAWPLQAIALSLASVAIVQPALGLGLIVLLVLGVRVLHERVGAREIGGAIAITAAGGRARVGGSARDRFVHARRAGRGRRARRARGGRPVRAARARPRRRDADEHLRRPRVGGGRAGDRADRRRDRGPPLDGRLLWGAAVAAAGWSGLLSEMTALQTWPATRAIPVVFGLEMALPAALAPLITSTGPTHAVAFVAALAAALGGAIVLGSSPAVGRAAHPLTEP